MKKKIVAIIQARMNSTRLPGKVLLPLYNRPALDWIIDRCSASQYVKEVVIATTTDPSNNPIKERYPYLTYRYKGKEDDVIGRVLAAAKWTKADVIVDVTGDCPMVDPNHTKTLIEILLKRKNVDYISNCVPKRSWPDGLDIQVYKTSALEKCINVFNPQQHCGWNIGQHPAIFRIMNFPAPGRFNWPELGLTLDTPEDYKLLKILFEKFGVDPYFSSEDVIMYLRENPELVEINKKIIRKTPEEG